MYKIIECSCRESVKILYLKERKPSEIEIKGHFSQIIFRGFWSTRIGACEQLLCVHTHTIILLSGQI